MFKSLIAVYNMIDAKTRMRIPFAFFIMLLLSVLEILGISLVFPLVQSVTGGASVLTLSYFKTFFNWINIGSYQHISLMIASFVFGLFIIKNIFSIFLVKWQVKFLAEADFQLSVSLMRRYMAMPYSAFLSTNSVDMARNVMNVVSSACSGFLGSLLIIVTELTMVIGIVGMLFIFSPWTMLSISLFMAAMAWVFQFYFKGKIIKSGQVYLAVTTKAWKDIVQTFLVIKDLRVLGREKNVFNHFYQLREQLLDVENVQKFTQQLPRYFLEIVFSLAALLFCLFVFKFQKGDVTTHLALLGVVGVAFVRLIPSVNRILSTLQIVRGNLPAVAVLQQPIPVEPIFIEKLPLSTDKTSLSQTDQGLILKNVSFMYPNREKLALNNIDLVIQWGESVGLVGESGSGKSTLIDVILGLLPPSAGKVFLDGEELSEHVLSWRQRIGYVPQNIYLCDDTVKNNIALGLSEDEIDQDALLTAIKLSNIEKLIDSLPTGLDTIVGEQGVQLSGGQRQCIGIARALYHNPSVLILDEATSALDNESERRISDMFEKLYREKTLIIVAHRLSTVRRCDKIVFMDQGRIGSTGTFDFLQENHSGFKRLVELGTL
jgi:ABC-type multidrug transport system fused ATPase/permease subunit